MSKRYQSSLVICPYYQGQLGNVIYCESTEPDSNIHLTFGTPTKLRDYQQTHCNSWDYACSGCLIAKGLEEQWNGTAREEARQQSISKAGGWRPGAESVQNRDGI